MSSELRLSMSTTRREPRVRLRRVRVTDRDLALLRALVQHRCLTVTQVQGLFFPSEQTARRRLRLLDQLALVQLVRVLGYPERLVGLQKAGAELLGLDPSRTTFRPPSDHYFIRHLVGINDFRIGLERACLAQEDPKLLGFISESAGERNRYGGVRRKLRQDLDVDGVPIGHTPDGVFALRHGQSAALFFLEIDRGTEVVGRPDRGVGKICRFYLGYLTSGSYVRYTKDFGWPKPFRGFRALIVTTGVERIQNIQAAARELSPEQPQARRFIWLSTEAEVRGHGPLESIWTSLDPDDETRYAILPK